MVQPSRWLARTAGLVLGAAGGYAAGLAQCLPIVYQCCHQGTWLVRLHGVERYGPNIAAPYRPTALLVMIAGLCVGDLFGRVYAERKTRRK